jgi:hypothetical protein
MVSIAMVSALRQLYQSSTGIARLGHRLRYPTRTHPWYSQSGQHLGCPSQRAALAVMAQPSACSCSYVTLGGACPYPLLGNACQACNDVVQVLRVCHCIAGFPVHIPQSSEQMRADGVVKLMLVRVNACCYMLSHAATRCYTKKHIIWVLSLRRWTPLRVYHHPLLAQQSLQLLLLPSG